MTGQIVFNGLTAYIARTGNGGLAYEIGAFSTAYQVDQFIAHPETFITNMQTGSAQHRVSIQLIEESPAAIDIARLSWDAAQKEAEGAMTLMFSDGGGSITRPSCKLMQVTTGEAATYQDTIGGLSKSTLILHLEFLQLKET